MYYLKINGDVYGHGGDMIPMMELGLQCLEWFCIDTDRMEIWDDKRMVMRLAQEHELQGDEEWRWLPGLRAIK